MSTTDTDDLRASILRVVKYNTGGPQPDSAAEHVLVELLARRGTAPATVQDALATLVEDGHLDRIDGEDGPRYQLTD